MRLSQDPIIVFHGLLRKFNLFRFLFHPFLKKEQIDRKGGNMLLYEQKKTISWREEA